jgi:hypothetical protein
MPEAPGCGIRGSNIYVRRQRRCRRIDLSLKRSSEDKRALRAAGIRRFFVVIASLLEKFRTQGAARLLPFAVGEQDSYGMKGVDLLQHLLDL